MRASDIAAVIEELAPLRLQEPWDNSGFCIGDGSASVRGVLVGFDCTPELIDEARMSGADMVITHHPLIFGGIKKISEATMTGRTVIAAIRHNITVYSCHTNMDKVLRGVSGTAAGWLGLRDVRVLDMDEDGNGLGVIGTLPDPMAPKDFLRGMKAALGLSTVRHSQLPRTPVRTVAVCGGSGRSLISKQIAEEIRKFFTKRLFEIVVPRNIRLVEASSYGKPIMMHDPKCTGARAYKALTQEYLDREEKKKSKGAN